MLVETTHQPGPLLILEDLANHDNVGACFRIAAAFGCRGVVLSPECADPLYRKALRVSSGHALRVPWCWGTHRSDQWLSAIETVHTAGFVTLAMTPAGTMTLGEAVLSASLAQTAMLIGAEGPGLRPKTLASCRLTVRLEMTPGVDSLNAAIACAIGLYEITKPRSAEQVRTNT